MPKPLGFSNRSDPDPDIEKSRSENSPYEASIFCLSTEVVIPGVNPQIQGKSQFPLFFNRFKAICNFLYVCGRGCKF